jgi:predicted nucleotidyltransferase
MRRTAAEILRLLEQNSETIRSHGARRLGLFGSAAHGTAGADSDVDFVVEFDCKSFDAYMNLKAYLEDLLGCPVDLVVADVIKPRLRDTILAEALHAPGL